MVAIDHRLRPRHGPGRDILPPMSKRSRPPASPPPPGDLGEAPPTRPFLMTLLRDWGIAIGVVLAVIVAMNAFMSPAAPALGPAPDFVLTDLDGREVRLSEVDDDLLILNFWFTTCPPCRVEIPHFSRYHRAHPDIPMYGVSTDVGMPTGRLKAESARLGIDYPVLHDVQADVARLYGVDVFPTTLVISDGEIVQAKVGVLDEEMLAAMVERARGG
jgi:peroxiredoxin